MDFLRMLWQDRGPSSDPRPPGQGDSDSNCPTSKRICKYDVFISFRGADTRNNFTDHLYNHLTRKGIFTFKDDKRLEAGQPISLQLLQAIQDSRVSIVVFSKDYAASTWCLEEMATIADCQRDLKQTVFPVFYDVEPSVVRYQIGEYRDAFFGHKFRKDASKVARWKRAMRNLANNSGYDVRNKPEVREIERIVKAVIKSLDHKFSGHADDLIGIQPRVHELENLLKLSSEDDGFRVLGICGMGGIGKTTIATVLYDKISYLFDGSCFVENLSQDYKAGGATVVQKQILRQSLDEKHLETYSPSEISGIIRNRLHRRKVLLVLDNVDELEQLEKLAISPGLLCEGSRIIITTKDEHILKVYGADVVYKVPLLDNDVARELFCIKAFESEFPGGRFVELMSEVLNYTQSLPLAIRVMGSSLCTRDVSQWRAALDRLGNNPDNQIMDVLQISFERLLRDEKEIFLHIACFFAGEREDYVKRILGCCGLYPGIGIPILIEKSLITIRNQEIHMHQMLQELGKKIVRDESPGDLGSQSRLWLCKDFYDALKSKMGMNKNKAIVLDQKKDVSKYSQLQVEELSKMRALELLILYEMNCSGRLNFLSNNLHFLLWHGYPFTYLPSDFRSSKLVELNMSNSNIKQLCEGIKNLPCLKRLDLSNSINLLETPNFEGTSNLERLDLTGCINLTDIHPSIGLLKELVFLSLRNCSNLVNLYLDSVSNLSALRILYLSGCTKLENTPDFTRMSNLEYLDVEQCVSLLMIHESLGTLGKLKFLSLRHCNNLVRIPNSVNTMISLETLDLSNCLKLMNLPLRRKPELENCCMESLVFLDLGFCNLCEVPDAIGELSCLERLCLHGNYFDTLPDTICQLFRLAYLNLSHCHELQYLPLLPSNSGSIIGGMYFEKVSGSRNHRSGLYMLDCPKLVESELNRMHGSKLALAWLTRLVEEPRHFRCGFDIVIPTDSIVIPEWFNHQFIGGDVVRIVHSVVSDNWIGFAFCVEFEVNYDQANFGSSHDSSSSSLAQSSSPSLSLPPPHPLFLSFESENMEEIFKMPLDFNLEKSVGSKHLWLIYISQPHCHFVKTGAHITFKARPGLEIRKWGFRMVLKQRIVDVVSWLRYETELPIRWRISSKGDRVNYVHETPMCSSWPKVQLPYNWLATEEEEKENMEANEKENNISIIGLGQPLLEHTSSSFSRKLPPRHTYMGPSSNPRPSRQGDTNSNCSTSKRICKYDVFISFKGTGTCANFTNHLCNHLIRKGIFIFKDDKVLEIGQPISSQLLQAIIDSRVSIIIFSKDYAASTWCLEEMATIADCQKALKQSYFPIFYDVDPSVVRNQTGVYQTAFMLHSMKFKSKVDRWKRAMMSLANSVDWDVRDKSQSIEIEKIVQAVIKILGHKFSGLADDLIGIQPSVHELENLLKLSSEEDGFRVLGIWGMGRKTTLAAVLYDRISYQFDSCCFIENVSQIYKDGGATAVQSQILRQTLDEKNLEIYSPSEISGIVRNRLRRIKFLLVLANVDQLQQLRSLPIIPKLLRAGSRIIITTMKEHILEVYGADVVHMVP